VVERADRVGCVSTAGFLGALVTTLLASLWFSRYLSQYQWLVCPRKDLTILKWLHCEPANTFRALPATETFAPLPGFVRHAVLAALPKGTTIMPIQLHALSFAVRAAGALDLFHKSANGSLTRFACTQMFAAVIAPFGGFFASGFKRALRVKDFGDSIPGHGGLTDRMDCQVVMAVFSYIYIDSIVGLGCVSLGVARLAGERRADILPTQGCDGGRAGRESRAAVRRRQA